MAYVVGVLARGVLPPEPLPFGGGEYSPCECSPNEYSLQNPHLFDVGSTPLASAPPTSTPPSEPLAFWRWGVLSRRILLRRALPIQTRVQKLRARLERNIARAITNMLRPRNVLTY